MRRVSPLLVTSIATTLVTAALLLAAAGTSWAETADERALRDHAAGNNLPAVQELLARGANPNVPDHNGRTAVHHAAHIAKANILEALLQAGGVPDARDAAGSTPLHLAADFPYFEPASQLSVRVLLAFGADPGIADREGRTPLHLAAGNHEEAASIRDLLSSGANANAADHRGDTPLHYAAGPQGKFSADVVAALVDGGARGGAVGGSGETALQLFVRVGTNNGWIVEALVAGGADPDAKNPEGETPLLTAIRSGGSAENPEVVAALLASGADPCITDASGYIPYNTAREGGDVHDMLASAGGSDMGCGGGEAIAELDADLVRRIQSALASKGYDPGPIDGVMGGGTRSAIAAWQDGTGFPATGELTVDEIDLLLAEAPEHQAEPSADTQALVAALSPKCSDGQEHDKCWRETVDDPGCFVWDDYANYFPVDTRLTWSGSCSGGVGDGQGALAWETEREVYEESGQLVRGIRQGLWSGGDEWGRWEFHMVDGVFHGLSTSWNADGRVREKGNYVDGEKQGHWFHDYDWGLIEEGAFSGGIKHGHWVERHDGSHDEGSYVDGEKHGHWVERSADGSVSEGSYANGEKHGQWIYRDADGSSIEGSYVNGVEHGHWIIRYGEWADWLVKEGSYVDGEKHGIWTSRFPSGYCDADEYSYGEEIGSVPDAC